MKNKAVIFGTIIVILAGVVVFILWRAHIMGPGATASSVGLVAVSANGTPIPPQAEVVMAEMMPENSAIQEAGSVMVTLALDPYPPTVAKSTRFEVTLAGVNGEEISDASISLDLTMPGMMMPPNQISLEPMQAGMYQGSGLFTMGGPWRIEVIITSGGTTQSVYFDITL